MPSQLLFSLSCPAQGSPVPAYRCVFQRSIAEPVGGSTPKFSGELTIKGLVKPLNLPFSLSCPAQGSPLPSFRFVVISPFLQSRLEARPQSFHLTKKAPLWREDLFYL